MGIGNGKARGKKFQHRATKVLACTLLIRSEVAPQRCFLSFEHCKNGEYF